MKFKALALLAVMSSAYAGDFGGVSFHSSVESSQEEALIQDYKYLFQTPVKNADAEFLSTAKLEVGDGPNMHNWLLNRVKYIVGESFEFSILNIVMTNYTFPSTPIPELPKQPANPDTNTTAKTVMSNLGSALYMAGKQNGQAFGIRTSLFSKMYAKSPRVGILQVGEGLFFKKFLLNENLLAPANSISRLATLFHEARHSDGNGKSTSFMHAFCPIGHSYSGLPACEAAGNGPYSVGALSQRHLLQNCDSCSTAEKTALTAGVADSFNRVIDVTTKSKIDALKDQIETAEQILSMYEYTLLPAISSIKSEKEKIEAEILRLKAQIADAKKQIVLLENSPKAKPEFYDDAPEGEFEVISLKDSKKKVERSLR